MINKNKYLVKNITIDNVLKSDVPPVDFFAQIEWLELFQKDDKFSLIGIFNKNEDLVGYFYYYNYKRKRFIRQISNPPLTPHCGLSLKLPEAKTFKNNSNTKQILLSIAQYLKKIKAGIISFSFPNKYSDFQTFNWEKYKVIPHYTYQLDIQKSDTELMDNMSPERRKNLKTQLDDFEKFTDVKENKNEIIDFIYSDTNSNPLVLEKSFFISFLEILNNLNSIVYGYKSKHNEILAISICLVDKRKSTYIYGAINQKKKIEGLASICIWKSILESQKKNCEIFDFEGSMAIDVERFYRGFGADLIPYYTVNRANFIWEVLLKKIDRAHF